MRDVDQAALVADGLRRLDRRQTLGDTLGQKQTDDLPRMGLHLLADHHTGSQLALQLLGSTHGVVIGDAHHVDA